MRTIRGLVWFRRLFLLLVISAGLGAGAKCSEPARAAAPELPESQVEFAIRLRHGSTATGACGGDVWRKGTLGTPGVDGVPVALSLNGSTLPNVLVSLVAAPTSTVGAPDVASLTVVRITSVTQLLNLGLDLPLDGVLTPAPSKMLVEVVMYPRDGKRLAFGYDGCESGAPSTFIAPITASASNIKLDPLSTVANLGNPSALLPSLRVFGARYDAVDNLNRPHPLAVNARLAPMPNTVGVNVDILPNDAYVARITNNTPTEAKIDFVQKVGNASTEVDGLVRQLQGDTTINFSPTAISYNVVPRQGQTLPTPVMSLVDVKLSQFTPAPITTPQTVGPRQPPSGTHTNLRVILQNLPSSATFTRTGTSMVFDSTTGAIGTADVTFSSAPTGVKPGALSTPTKPQYVLANVTSDSINGAVRLLGLSHAEVDTGTKAKVTATHTSGPFELDAIHSSTPTCGRGGCPIITRPLVRHLHLNLSRLPSTATVTYDTMTGEFTYTGTQVIEDLVAELNSSEALVSNAHDSWLHLVEVPTGLTGRINAAAQTFTATMANDAKIRTVEARVTSGPTEALPPEVDGILLRDEATSYLAFVRVSGLKSATVTWGATQGAVLTHKEGPFRIFAHLHETSGPNTGLTVSADIVNLPATTTFLYTPLGSAVKLVYAGSNTVQSAEFTVDKEQPFIPDTDATRMHTIIRGLPTRLQIDIDTTAKTVRAFVPPFIVQPPDSTQSSAKAIGPGGLPVERIGEVIVDLCSPNMCRGALHPEAQGIPLNVDGVWLNSRTFGYELYGRISKIEDATIGWGDTLTAKLKHVAAAFEAHTAIDKTETRRMPGTECGGGGIETDPTGGPRNEPPDECEPTDPYDVEVPYTEHVDVVIRDLPARVNFTFNALQKKMHYDGSATIGSIVVDFDKGGQFMVAGRAPTLHVELLGVTDLVDFSYGWGDGDGFNLDTGAGKIGHVAVDLLSDPALLSKPGVAEMGAFQSSNDGLVFWDLVDTDHGTYNINDPFILSARVTNLKKFTYDETATTDAEGYTHKRRSGTATRAPGPGGGVKNIVVDIKVRGNGETDGIDGLANPIPRDSIRVNYWTVPEDIGFVFTQIGGPTDEYAQQFLVDVWGSRVGGGIIFDTNVGPVHDLHAELNGIPAGTATSRGLRACISPDSLFCIPTQYDATDANSPGNVSFWVDAKTPINVVVHLVAHELVVDASGTVEQYLAVGSEPDVEGCCPNSTFVYLDTKGKQVAAHVDINSDGDHTILIVPKGTRALQRYVEIENDGVSERNYGELACPEGFSATTDFLIDQLSLADDVCTFPTLTGIGPNTRFTSTPGQQVIDVYGRSFGGLMNLTGEWTGPHVLFPDSSGLLRFDKAEVVDIHHMRVYFTPIDPSARNRNHRIFLQARTDIVDPASTDSPFRGPLSFRVL